MSCSCAGASARGHPCTGPPESPSAQCGAPARGVAVCAFVPGPGGGGGVCSPGLPVLLASQPGHPFRAGVSTACWGAARTLGPSLCHGPCLPGGSGSNARAQEARPAPVYRFHPHFLVQSDVNLSLEKGGRACSRWRHCSRSPGGPTTQHVPGRRCRPESRDRRDGSTPFSIVLSSLTALMLGKV